MWHHSVLSHGSPCAGLLSWKGWECGRSCQGCSGVLGWMGKVSGGSSAPGSHCCQASQWECRPAPGVTKHVTVTLQCRDPVLCSLCGRLHSLFCMRTGSIFTAPQEMQPSRLGMKLDGSGTLHRMLPVCMQPRALYQKGDLLSRPPLMYDCSHRRSAPTCDWSVGKAVSNVMVAGCGKLPEEAAAGNLVSRCAVLRLLAG